LNAADVSGLHRSRLAAAEVFGLEVMPHSRSAGQGSHVIVDDLPSHKTDSVETIIATHQQVRLQFTAVDFLWPVLVETVVRQDGACGECQQRVYVVR
jgi:hypothetical protein